MFFCATIDISIVRRDKMYPFYYNFGFFIVYSIAGWCVEVIYAAFAHKKFVNRGFLNGPVCPIYGVGAIGIVYIMSPFENLIEGKWFLNLILLFISSTILTSILELVVGWILERFFHQKWWDYTDDPMNFKGYVCVPFSLIWGGFCVALVKLIFPALLWIIAKIPLNWHIAVFVLFYGVFFVDLLITGAELAKIGQSIRLASDIDKVLNTVSGIVGKPISAGTIFSLEQKSRFENACHNLIAKAKSFYGDRYKEYKFKLSPVHKRIQEAYPNLQLTGTEDVGAKISKLSEWVDHIRTALDKTSEKSRKRKERRAQASLERKNARSEKKKSRSRRKQEAEKNKASKYGRFAGSRTDSFKESKPGKKGRNNRRKKQSR